MWTVCTCTGRRTTTSCPCRTGCIRTPRHTAVSPIGSSPPECFRPIGRSRARLSIMTDFPNQPGPPGQPQQGAQPGPQPPAQQAQGWAPGAQPPGQFTQPAAGPQWQQAPGHQGWAPGQQWQQGPGAPIPLTRPGWGAIPAVLGAVLGVLGLFALKWSGDVTWFELADAMRNISGDDLNGEQVLVKFYIGKGVIIAATLAAVAPIPWSFGVFRDERSIRRGGGIMKRSLLEGRTGPTRALLTGIAAAALLYH